VAAPILGPRALNRALLARQFLLARRDVSATDAVAHLVGMQAQAPLAPYVGLWSRLREFAPADLAGPLEGRALVRATLMRGTVHLVTADDALTMRVLMEPAIVRGFRGGSRPPRDVEQVVALARELLHERPRTRAELREAFRGRWPDRDADAMAYAVSHLLPTLQPTPRGIWGRNGRAELALLTTWLGRELDGAPSVDAVVLRYLGAFGPATVKDVQAWSGLTGLREVVERLAPDLRTFRSVRGDDLHDLPDAPRPDPDTPVPPRFLPEYDNVLLSHHDRTRITDPARVVPLPPGTGARTGTFLLDGRFAGTWTLGDHVLEITPHAPLDDTDATALQEEAAGLLHFLEAPGRDVSLTMSPSARRPAGGEEGPPVRPGRSKVVAGSGG
jgi:hypothetical protein